MLDTKIIEENVAEIEKRFGLAEGFIVAILNDEDDWGLTLKLHSLIESLFNQLIIESVGIKEIEAELSKLNFRTKFSIIMALGYEKNKKKTISFLNDFSSVRNKYVHNIKNINRSLLDISGEMGLKSFTRSVDNDRLRLLIWVRTIFAISELNVRIAMKAAQKGKLEALVELGIRNLQETSQGKDPDKEQQNA